MVLVQAALLQVVQLMRVVVVVLLMLRLVVVVLAVAVLVQLIFMYQEGQVVPTLAVVAVVTEGAMVTVVLVALVDVLLLQV